MYLILELALCSLQWKD